MNNFGLAFAYETLPNSRFRSLREEFAHWHTEVWLAGRIEWEEMARWL